MCGIIGYVGNKQALEVVYEGLLRMEYRGYDSAGVALQNGKQIKVFKDIGKISQLKTQMFSNNVDSHLGIGHTRWATHGIPSKLNSHPHSSENHDIYVIHNGIIENYNVIKKKLLALGYNFTSDTDTEVLAHLFSHNYNGDLFYTVRESLKLVEGTFGLCVISQKEPGVIVGARRGSPVIIGIGEDESFLASDLSAIIGHTKNVIYMADNEVVKITKDNIIIKNHLDEPISPEIQSVDWDLEQIEKGGFTHFMLKEIYEQPMTIANAFKGRIVKDRATAKLGGLNLSSEELRNIKRIVLIACGTSWHAALIGEYMLEEYTRLPVEVEYASEFRYRNPVLNEDDLVIVISQSGETADTLAALKEAKEKGVKVLAISNVVGSTIAREADGGVYIHAGPEIGVASTKAFTSQVTVLALLTLFLGRLKDVSKEVALAIINDLEKLPSLIQEVLEHTGPIKDIAQKLVNSKNFLYLGRGINFPVALEGALKLKEISYIHAEGYPAAEMKHGPIALIDENMPVVVIANDDHVFDKILTNIQEIKARSGVVITLTNSDDDRIKALSDYVLIVPKIHTVLTPILNAIPLQLLAYYIAVERGCDVDQPRNLAKSVTVE